MKVSKRMKGREGEITKEIDRERKRDSDTERQTERNV